jgi:vacuolar-type H+-ATPase subunit E/Vma4
MDMQRQQLREYLEELNSVISDLDGQSDKKTKLTSLIAEIELQLNEPKLVTGEPQTLSSQVDNMVTTFEQDHPRVAGVLNNIMLTLSNMGV